MSITKDSNVTLNTNSNIFEGMRQIDQWLLLWGAVLDCEIEQDDPIDKLSALHLNPISLDEMRDTYKDGFDIREYDPPLESTGDYHDYLQQSAWIRPTKSDIGVANYPNKFMYKDSEDFDRFDKWVEEVMLYGPNTDEVRDRRTWAILDALETVQTRGELDAIMLCVNYYHCVGIDKCLQSNDWNTDLVLNKYQSAAIKDIYKCQVINFRIPNSKYFTTSEGTVFDMSVVEDSKRSAGGWSQVWPEQDVDFKNRNGFDIDTQALNQSDVKLTNTDRGADFTRMLARSTEDKNTRYNIIKNKLTGMESAERRLAYLRKVEVKRYESIKEVFAVKDSPDWTKLYLTAKQLGWLRELNSKLTEASKPAPF